MSIESIKSSRSTHKSAADNVATRDNPLNGFVYGGGASAPSFELGRRYCGVKLAASGIRVAVGLLGYS